MVQFGFLSTSPPATTSLIMTFVVARRAGGRRLRLLEPVRAHGGRPPLMHRTLSTAEAASLPDDVIVSVEGITRAAPPPFKGVPRWLARVLPKSGLAGRTGQEIEDLMMDDEDEDEDDDDYLGDDGAALRELNFEVRRGEGIGIAGTTARPSRPSCAS